MKPVAIPVRVKMAHNDYVSWRGKGSHDGYACFSPIMSCLSSASLVITPAHSKAAVSNDVFLQWMELCQEHGLVPPKAIAHIKKKQNTLEIPARIYDRHLMYAALCCYRWSDSCAPMVWQIVKHMEKQKNEFTFWQALHYGLAHHKTQLNHSFSYITNAGYEYYGANRRNDLSQSLCLPIFFGYTIAKRKKITGATNNAIAQLAKSLCDLKYSTAKICGYSYQVQEPTLKIDNFSELLTSKWTPLYRLKSPTKAKLQKLYKEISE